MFSRQESAVIIIASFAPTPGRQDFGLNDVIFMLLPALSAHGFEEERRRRQLGLSRQPVLLAWLRTVFNFKARVKSFIYVRENIHISLIQFVFFYSILSVKKHAAAARQGRRGEAPLLQLQVWGALLSL